MYAPRAPALRLACAVALAAAVGAGALSASACTTFDGLSAAPAAKPPVDSGPEDAGVPGLLSVDDAVKTCSWVFKCPKLARSVIESVGVPVDSSNFALCVDWLAGPVDLKRVGLATQTAMLKCISKATTCEEAGRCTAYEYISQSDPRCAGIAPDAGETWAERCIEDAGAIAYCSPEYDGLVVRCTTGYFDPKSKCLSGKGGVLSCAVDKTCPGATCDSTFFYDICSKSSEIHMRYNCSATGQTCGTDDAGYIGCLTAGVFENCDLYAVTCVGSRVRVCDGANQSYFDCAGLGGTCVENGAMARCTRPQATCDPAEFNSITCTGNVISLCIGGNKLAFDCSKVGLACKPEQVPLTPSCG